MHEVDLTSLAQSIGENGLLEPIVLYDGKILDGRNRYVACKRVNIEPTFIVYTGKMDPIDYVIAKNLERRHLTPAQKAESALKTLEQKRKLRKKQIKTLKSKKEENKRMQQALDKKDKKNIAKKYNTTIEKIEQYEKIKKEIEGGNYEIKKEWEKAKKGKVTITAVYREIRQRNQRKTRKRKSWKEECMKLGEKLRLKNMSYNFVKKRCKELKIWEEIWEVYKPIEVADPSIEELRKAELI